MSRITRKHLKIFALAATNNGQFGSAQTGAKVTSQDLDTLQALSAYGTGWLDAVLGTKKFPALEEFQALGYICTYEIAYLFQEGLPEYLATTTYYMNSIVKKPGTYQLYGSKTDANVGNALTDTVNWQFLIDLADNALPTDLVYETHVQTITNKTLVLPILTVLDSEFTIQDNLDPTKQALFQASGITAGQTRIYTLPDGSTTLVGTSLTQTLQNKTLDNTNTINVKGSFFTLQDATATTKRANFVLSSITAGQTRQFTLQDRDGTVALLDDIRGVEKIKIKQITATGTYTPDANLIYAVVEGVGAGGGSYLQSTGFYPGGGAGGGFRGSFSAAQLAPSVAVTIGAGSASSTGGSTSFGAFMSATGGQTGGVSRGGGGGIGTGGDENWNGEPGGTGHGGPGYRGFGSGMTAYGGNTTTGYEATGRNGCVWVTEYCSA